MKKMTILLIDDEPSQLKSLESFLRRRDYTIFTAGSGPEGLETAKKQVVDLVLTDYRMPEWNGLTVVRKIKELNPGIDIVVMTAYGNIEDAVEIMKAGAYDYLNKPIDLDDLEKLLNRVAEKRQMIHENQIFRDRLPENFKFDMITTQSPEMEEVLNTAGRVAASKATILIRGESGTGKELIARAIHYASERRDQPFVVVNVAALSETLIESELFGHEKGAFTGAAQQRAGRFEQADKGTLFIDEVGEIPPPVQVKLLRAIQFGQIERLGGTSTLSVDVRILAATHRDLEAMIREGEFRDDLYYRLNVIAIHIPPLHRRKTDIPVLVNHFIDTFARENHKEIEGISQEALDQLLKYDFPGNVRELENIIEHAVVLCRDRFISARDLPLQINSVSGGTALDPYHLEEGYETKIREFETVMIREALKRADGNQSAAARMLQISERHLRSRLEKLGLKK
jgi:two-component system NtrC family response regulator